MTSPSTSAPLAGVRVLVPRAPGRGAGLAALVESAGGEAIVAPLISRAPIDGPERDALDAAVRDLLDGTVDWVAVTSVNAIDELGAAVARARTAPAAEPLQGALTPVATAARWAAVGPATARALRAQGVEPALVARENSARGLLAEWPDDPPGSRVLLPVGDLAEPTLEVGLAERGHHPLRVTAYRTVSHDAPPEVVADWTAGRIDVVVLTSGSVAREVARQLGPRPDVLAVAIGQPTRRAAEGTGQPVASVATSATDDALLAAVLDACRAAPPAHRRPQPHTAPAPAPAPPEEP